MSTRLKAKSYSVRIFLFFVVALTPSISKGDNYFTLPQYITSEVTPRTFQIASNGKAAAIYVDTDD